MEENERREKLRWLSSCRLETISGHPTKFIRHCACGASLWIETPADDERGEDEERAIWSWIDSHFGHTAEKLVAASSVEARYDFTKAIRFSREGFRLFVEEFGLELCALCEEAECGAYFDRKENMFVFIESDSIPKSEYEGVAFTFDPEESRITQRLR